MLLDLLASSPRPPRVRELPYSFRERRHGESKLDAMVAWEYGMLLTDKLVGRFIPVRFALFAWSADWACWCTSQLCESHSTC